jgi:hypothetical protein
VNQLAIPEQGLSAAAPGQRLSRRDDAPFAAGRAATAERIGRVTSPAMKTITFLMFALALTLLAACEREGPAERAGEAIDRAAEDVRDAVKGK